VRRPHSWWAIRAKLQQIIEAEDKSKPFSDDQIRQELVEAGIKNRVSQHLTIHQ
jgi:DNA-directed RNA polymerase specialized sigma54-like protein